MQTPFEHIYQIRIPLPFRLDHVNSYLIRDESGWSVIDPGLDTSMTESLWGTTLRQLDLQPSDIKRIFITHFHPDHYGFAGKMQRWTQATVYASSLTYWLADQYFSKEQVDRNHLFYRKCGMSDVMAEEVAVLDLRLLDQISTITGKTENLRENESILLGGTPFEIILGGGHAEGSTGFWNQEKLALIGGDMLLQKITPNIIFSYDEDENPLQQYFETLRSLRRKPIQTVLPGHGPVFQLHPGFIESVIEHHEERLKHIQAIVHTAGDKALTIYEICMLLFNKVFNTESARFALGETAAHLRYLERRKLLELQEFEGKYFFSAMPST